MSLKQALFTRSLTRLLDVGRNAPTHSDKRENIQVWHVPGVSSDHQCCTRTWCSIESVDVPSRGRSMAGRRLLTGLQFMCTPHKCTSHCPTTERHLRTLYHVYETCCCHQLTRSKYSWPFSPSTRTISRLTSDLPSAACRRSPVFLTEHVDTKVSRSRSTNQGFIRNLRSNHLCPVPAISSPVSIRPLTDLPSVPPMQGIVQFHAMEHFNVNVTHAEKHTLGDREQFHLRMHHDAHITRSVTMYAPSCSLPLKTRLPAASRISIRGRVRYFVARSAVLVSVGCLRSRNAFSRAPRAT